MRPIVLASTSPYRRALLARLRLDFAVAAPPVDEAERRGERPSDRACRLAREKATSLRGQFARAIIIGGDQTIADDAGAIYDKPGTEQNAIAQLLRMRGKTLHFYTAVAVCDAAADVVRHKLVTHTVVFRQADEGEIRRYVAREPALNCAGGAQIEGLGIALTDSISGGDPTALIGMPLLELAHLLRAVNIPIP